MANAKRKFEPAFKAEAVRLVRERGRAVAGAARSLEVHVNALRGWVRATATTGKRVHRPEAAETVPRLERELESRLLEAVASEDLGEIGPDFVAKLRAHALAAAKKKRG